MQHFQNWLFRSISCNFPLLHLRFVLQPNIIFVSLCSAVLCCPVRSSLPYPTLSLLYLSPPHPFWNIYLSSYNISKCENLFSPLQRAVCSRLNPPLLLCCRRCRCLRAPSAPCAHERITLPESQSSENINLSKTGFYFGKKPQNLFGELTNRIDLHVDLNMMKLKELGKMWDSILESCEKSEIVLTSKGKVTHHYIVNLWTPFPTNLTDLRWLQAGSCKKLFAII